MRYTRAMDLRDYAVSAIIGIYSHGRAFSETAMDMDAKVRRILDELRAKKAPEWVVSYARGYRQALTDNLYRSELVHGGMVNGRFMSTHSNRDDYYEKQGICASVYADHGTAKARGHYWAHSLKPYFTMDRD